jgi:hypothetical protein
MISTGLPAPKRKTYGGGTLFFLSFLRLISIHKSATITSPPTTPPTIPPIAPPLNPVVFAEVEASAATTVADALEAERLDATAEEAA